MTDARHNIIVSGIAPHARARLAVEVAALPDAATIAAEVMVTNPTPPFIRFFAPGEPCPQGSMRAFIRGGRPIVTSDNKRTQPWRSVVSMAASEAMAGRGPIDGAVSVEITFRFARPKGHVGKAGRIRASAPTPKATKPDLDKLQRAAFDAMTGIVFTDDARVVRVLASKVFVTGEQPQPGVLVVVSAAA